MKSSSAIAGMDSFEVAGGVADDEEAASSAGRSMPFSLCSVKEEAAATMPSFSSSGKVQLVNASHILSIMTKGPVKDMGGGRVVSSVEANGGTGNSPPGTGFAPVGTDRFGLKGI